MLNFLYCQYIKNIDIRLTVHYNRGGLTGKGIIMATIHLICGFMGFGKTTFSNRLAQQLPAVRLTHDEFMVDLYGRNMTDAEFHARYKCVDDILWKLAEKIIQSGTDVIMDYGFWNKETRKQVQAKAEKITRDVIWHQLVCDIAVAKMRVLRRTQEDQSELFIDESCFNEKLRQYKPISPDEKLNVEYHMTDKKS